METRRRLLKRLLSLTLTATEMLWCTALLSTHWRTTTTCVSWRQFCCLTWCLASSRRVTLSKASDSCCMICRSWLWTRLMLPTSSASSLRGPSVTNAYHLPTSAIVVALMTTTSPGESHCHHVVYFCIVFASELTSKHFFSFNSSVCCSPWSATAFSADFVWHYDFNESWFLWHLVLHGVG